MGKGTTGVIVVAGCVAALAVSGAALGSFDENEPHAQAKLQRVYKSCGPGLNGLLMNGYSNEKRTYTRKSQAGKITAPKQVAGQPKKVRWTIAPGYKFCRAVLHANGRWYFPKVKQRGQKGSWVDPQYGGTPYQSLQIVVSKR